MAHPLFQVLNSAPVDRIAARVTSQAGCAQEYVDLTHAEAMAVIVRLQRKHRLLKAILRVENKRQHKNLIARHKMGLQSNYRPPRAIAEYLRVGQNILVLQEAHAKPQDAGLKEARQKLGAIENAWRAEHPGAIWDGQQLVAPNGAVFSRAAQAATLEIS